MKKTLFILIIFIIGTAFKSDNPAYQIFSQEGKKVKYSKMMRALEEADVIFFGEQHNNPICHWLQLRVTEELYENKNENLILGAEMFERDNQLILNEYLDDIISKKSFEKEARLWPNYKTDYAPLIEFAKEKGLTFVASNIPRRYASRVYGSGFEGLEDLTDEAKNYIAPLPIEYDAELEGYKNMLKMAGGHGGANLPKAQAVKDATMAWSISQYMETGKVLIHYNGTYHSNNFEGILWYLNKYKPGLNIITIASEEQEDLDNLSEENTGIADFILVTPVDMTRTN